MYVVYVKLCVCGVCVCCCVCGRREEKEKEEEPGIQNQKQEPHTKMWGKRIQKVEATACVATSMFLNPPDCISWCQPPFLRASFDLSLVKLLSISSTVFTYICVRHQLTTSCCKLKGATANAMQHVHKRARKTKRVSCWSSLASGVFRQLQCNWKERLF